MPMLSPTRAGGRLLAVPGQVGVARRRAHRGMAEQPADHRQARAERQGARGIAVAQVVEPNILQAGLHAQAHPDMVDRHIPAAGLAAGEDPGIVLTAGDSGQHRLDCRGQRHPPGAGLCILQPQLRRNAVDIVPLQAQDLVPAAAGQQQQADRRDGDGILRRRPVRPRPAPGRSGGTRRATGTARAVAPCSDAPPCTDFGRAAPGPRLRPSGTWPTAPPGSRLAW